MEIRNCVVVIQSCRHRSRGEGQFPRRVLPQANAYAMIRRRAAAADRHQTRQPSFRATGITAYLENDGTLEKAAAMAGVTSRDLLEFAALREFLERVGPRR